MSEETFEIEKSQHNLFPCYICQTKFDKYALEIHYLETHNDVQNENLIKYEICDKILEAGKLRTPVKTIHEDQKDFKFDSCGKFFFMLVIWEDTSKLFMKVTKISNVNLVKNHILKLVL